MSAGNNYAATFSSYRVSAKRFDPSPWLSSYINDSTILGVYSGRFFALTIGEDPVEAYWRLRREAVLFDVPEHPIEISGPDALAFLNRIFCRDVSKLRVGRATYALACNHDGGVLMDGVLMRLEEDRYWYVLADGEILVWLDAHRRGFDVTLRDPSSWVLQLQGPRTFEVLPAILDEPLAEPMKYFGVTECRLAGEPFVISRTGWTGERGVELYSLNPDVDGERVFKTVLDSGRPAGMSFSALESMGIRRIEAGILDNGTDMDSSMTPFAAGLGRFVDLDKHDYLGREALREADRRCAFFGVTAGPDTPVGRHTVLAGSKEVGRLTTAARSPFLDKLIGYVRFDTGGDWAGRDVSLRALDGSEHAGKVVELPFYDKEKLLPRDLPQVAESA